jgi:hypothetical protein
MLNIVESRTRVLLTWSLGGLVLLGAVLGIGALAVFDRMHQDEAARRERFVQRRALLERIRGGIYVFGSLARGNPEQLRAIHEDVADAMRQYGPPADLAGEIATYWKQLDLMAEFEARPRTAALDAYFQGQLALRRATMLRITGEIAGAQERESRQADSELEAVIRRFRQLIEAGLGMVVALGIVVSVATARRCCGWSARPTRWERSW